MASFVVIRLGFGDATIAKTDVGPTRPLEGGMNSVWKRGKLAWVGGFTQMTADQIKKDAVEADCRFVFGATATPHTTPAGGDHVKKLVEAGFRKVATARRSAGYSSGEVYLYLWENPKAAGKKADVAEEKVKNRFMQYYTWCCGIGKDVNLGQHNDCMYMSALAEDAKKVDSVRISDTGYYVVGGKWHEIISG